ncbi:MAG: NAD(P)-dependent oxidoreductase [Candidatus Aenigmarchaeota archaeon]|nr:NAD(P)-dependent oxidoreductase [Candidatus Aenigmarchaeota archaeon]
MYKLSVLVTGASGFVGRRLLKKLSENNYMYMNC